MYLSKVNEPHIFTFTWVLSNNVQLSHVCCNNRSGPNKLINPFIHSNILVKSSCFSLSFTQLSSPVNPHFTKTLSTTDPSNKAHKYKAVKLNKCAPVARNITPPI